MAGKSSAWLEFHDPKTRKHTRIDLVEDNFSIGRKGANLQIDFQTADPAASHIHALITREKDAYVLRDLGSKNGTLVNESNIIEHRLCDGDLIRIGLSRFVFRQEGVFNEEGDFYSDEDLQIHPWTVFSNPQKFWTQATQTSVFDIQNVWLFHFSNLFFLSAESYLNGHAAPVVHLLTLWGCFLAAILCMSLFTKQLLEVSWQAAGRLIYYSSPTLVFLQSLFLILGGILKLSPLILAIGSLLPGIAIALFLAHQCKTIFVAPWKKLFAFSVGNWLLWNFFLTGLLSLTMG